MTRNVLPPPERALTSSVPLSCAGSKGLISATSRPGSVNANGIPVGEPQLVPTSGTVSPTCRVTYLRVSRATSRPKRQRGLPQLKLAQLPEIHAGVGRRDDLLGGVLDRLGQRDGVGVGSALADGLVDRDVVGGGALVPGELFEQLAELFLLGEHLVVRCAAAQLGAAVDPEQPAVPRLVSGALAQAVQRMHVHRQRERPCDLHRVKQPAELRRVRERRDVQRLLEIAIDAQVALIGRIDP